MKIIFGLGNIGSEYANTYHNMGFMVVDGCLSSLNINLTKYKNMCNGMVYETNVSGNKVYFVKPTTYMNNSGECVKSVMTKLKANIEDILVVVDDIDLPEGVIRIKPSGSAGTHNGLKSICGLVGNNYARLKIGVGKPAPNQPLVDFVLSNVPQSSKAIDAVKCGVQALLDYVNGAPLDRIMQKYNG